MYGGESFGNTSGLSLSPNGGGNYAFLQAGDVATRDFVYDAALVQGNFTIGGPLGSRLMAPAGYSYAQFGFRPDPFTTNPPNAGNYAYTYVQGPLASTTQAYSNGYYDPHTTVHRIGDDAYPYPTGPQTDPTGGYLLANTGVSGTDPMYQKLAGYTYGYYLDHNCSLPGGCYFGGSYGAYSGPNTASRFDGGRRFTGVSSVTYVSNVTCTCPPLCVGQGAACTADSDCCLAPCISGV